MLAQSGILTSEQVIELPYEEMVLYVSAKVSELEKASAAVRAHMRPGLYQRRQ